VLLGRTRIVNGWRRDGYQRYGRRDGQGDRPGLSGYSSRLAWHYWHCWAIHCPRSTRWAAITGRRRPTQRRWAGTGGQRVGGNKPFIWAIWNYLGATWGGLAPAIGGLRWPPAARLESRCLSRPHNPPALGPQKSQPLSPPGSGCISFSAKCCYVTAANAANPSPLYGFPHRQSCTSGCLAPMSAIEPPTLAGSAEAWLPPRPAMTKFVDSTVASDMPAWVAGR
jgi:hypothetical protein